MCGGRMKKIVIYDFLLLFCATILISHPINAAKNVVYKNNIQDIVKLFKKKISEQKKFKIINGSLRNNPKLADQPTSQGSLAHTICEYIRENGANEPYLDLKGAELLNSGPIQSLALLKMLEANIVSKFSFTILNKTKKTARNLLSEKTRLERMAKGVIREKFLQTTKNTILAAWTRLLLERGMFDATEKMIQKTPGILHATTTEDETLFHTAVHYYVAHEKNVKTSANNEIIETTNEDKKIEKECPEITFIKSLISSIGYISYGNEKYGSKILITIDFDKKDSSSKKACDYLDTIPEKQDLKKELETTFKNTKDKLNKLIVESNKSIINRKNLPKSEI